MAQLFVNSQQTYVFSGIWILMFLLTLITFYFCRSSQWAEVMNETQNQRNPDGKENTFNGR